MAVKRTNRKPHGENMTFAAALTGYWLARRGNFSPATISDYSRTYLRFSAFIGDTRLGDIEADDIHHFMEHMRTTYKLGKKSICNVWIALSSFWTWASTELGVEHIIRGHVQQPDYRTPPIEIYSEVQIKAMVGACSHAAGWTTTRRTAARAIRPAALRDQAIIITLVDTGVRASELCALEVRDYNEAQGRLLVREGKGDKGRIVFLGQAGRRILWRYMATREDAGANDPLFPTSTNRPIDRNNLRTMLQRIGARAGINGITVHRFRHTFAVNFLRNGGNLLELQEMLGHEKMETVRIYARLAEVDLAAAQRRSSVADKWRL